MYGNLVYKFKRIVGKHFHYQFKKITKHDKRMGYRMDSMRRSGLHALNINPTTVNSFGFEKGKDQKSIQSSTIPDLDTIWESDKTLENKTHKRVKRSALFQQVITRLKETDKTA